MASWLTARNSNLSLFNAININYSTLIGSTITSGSTISGSTINQINLNSGTIVTSTITINSSMISLGASTNKTYTNMSQGSVASQHWVQSLGSLTAIKMVAASANAQYQLIISQASTTSSLFTTSTLGQSWTNISGASGLPSAIQTSYTSGALSASGQYGIVTAYGGYPYLTSTYGSSFQNVHPNVPVIYLPFETVPANASLSGGTIPATLTVVGPPTSVTGIVGTNAISFLNNPASNAVQYLRATWVTTGVTSFTWSFWIKPQSIGARQNICFAFTGQTGVYLNANNTLTFIAGNTIIATTAFPLAINTWYSVIIIFQQSNTGYLYLNNVLIPSVSPCPITAGASSGSFSLACQDSSLVTPFNGHIDDFRLYNTAIQPTPMVPMNYSYTAISGNGQYILATAANNGLYLSSNYGATWTTVTSALTAAVWQGLSISASGQHMIAYSTPSTLLAQLTSLATSSWMMNGSTWTVSASSTTAPNYAYQAFDNLNGNAWFSGSTYNTNGSIALGVSPTTTVVSTGAVIGEWIQIQSSVPVVCTSIAFGIGSNAYPNTNTPRQYTIVGSNDGTTWYLLHTGSFSITGFTGTSNSILINSTSTQVLTTTMIGNVITVANAPYVTMPFTHFRLIGTQIMNYGTQNSSYMEVGEWYCTFTAGGQCYSTTYGQTWNNAYLIATPTYIAVSPNGAYAIGANGQTAYLVTTLSGFSTNTVSTLSLPGINAPITGAALSNTGQYQVIVTSGTTNNLFYSSGGAFTAITIGTTSLTSCDISFDGSYITVSTATTIYTLNANVSGFSLAIGNQAAALNQASGAIALGNQAGQQSQGQNAIAIGNQAATAYQSANSIVLNAMGTTINGYYPGFFVAPIASYTTSTSTLFSLLGYGPDNQIVQGLGSLTITNVTIGSSVGSSGSSNTIIGAQAGQNATGSSNTLIGYSAGQNVVGSTNVCLGSSAGLGITTGAANVILGSNAGTTSITGQNNLLIGQGAQLLASGDYNEIVIGQGISGNGTNSVTIGQSFVQTYQNATYFTSAVPLSPLPSRGMYIISVFSAFSTGSYSAAMYTAYYGAGNGGTTILQAIFTGANVTLTGTANGGISFVGYQAVPHQITYTKMGNSAVF